MRSDQFYTMISGTAALPTNLDLIKGDHWIHLVFFIHRVDGLAPGLYVLARYRSEHDLRATFSQDFVWTKPQGCPEHLNIHLLATGDARLIAKSV